MFKYEDIKAKVIAEKVDSETGIFDYSSSDYAKEYEDLFQFYQGNLVQHYYYGIDPAIFFFKNNLKVNAAAGKTPNGVSVCLINYGTIEKHLKNFKFNTTLLQSIPELSDLIEFENRINCPIHLLLFQASIGFTFYHELGHLIQKNEIPDFSNESYSNSGFDLQRHVNEMDSDTFSALSLGAHFYQFQEKHTLTLNSSDDAMTLVAILSSGVLLHMLSYPSYNVPFYKKVGSHPHASIRILHVIHTIADYYQLVFNDKTLGLSINELMVIKRTIQYSEIMCSHFYSSSIFDPLKDAVQNHETDMKSYYAELISLLNANEDSATFKRNQLAKK